MMIPKDANRIRATFKLPENLTDCEGLPVGTTVFTRQGKGKIWIGKAENRNRCVLFTSHLQNEKLFDVEILG